MGEKRHKEIAYYRNNDDDVICLLFLWNLYGDTSMAAFSGTLWNISVCHSQGIIRTAFLRSANT